MTGTRIDLAHEPDFEIGRLGVRPSTREIVRDGVPAIVEPRVMQVLVALHRANGAVVSKDDLVLSCWEGRVVGEDAINRVISRLRKLTEGIAADAFRIETVTKVGYRMIHADTANPVAAPIILPPVNRRLALAGIGSVAILGAGGWWWTNRHRDPLSPEAESLLARAREALLYGTPEQTSVGISLLQQATETAPDSGRLWGLLSLAYGQQAQQSSSSETRELNARAMSAAKRAIELDPGNADAQVAIWFSREGRETRAQYEKRCRDMLARFPDHPLLNVVYAFFLTQTGQIRASIPYFERTMANQPPSPPMGHAYASTLWAAGRLDEADKAMDEAFRLWPRHYGVWFTRYKLLAYTGRSEEALAMIADEGSRPVGVPDSNFELCRIEARALETRGPTDIERALEEHRKASRIGVGFVQNAITFCAAINRLDTAFELTQAYYFDKGFRLGEQRYTREQALYSPSRRRATYFLFSPPCKPMLADPRFAALSKALGLDEYWQTAGVKPDFRA